MCMICERGFARDDLLEVHMRYYHENGKHLLITHGEENKQTNILIRLHYKLDDKRTSTTGTQNANNDLSRWFSMRCDICLNDTPFSSFQHAKQHYKSVHGVTGYLVCCNKKFVKAKTVDNHLQWHINPELNKYVFKCIDLSCLFSI